MGKPSGGNYAVARGRQVGIFTTWDQCKAQVDGFPNARYKKFPTKQEAEAFIQQHSGTVTNAPSTSTSTKATGSGVLRSLPKPTLTMVSDGVFVRQLSTTSSVNKRSLKVTDERVINKRPRLQAANEGVDLTTFSVDEGGYVIVYTDGACKANGKLRAKAGIGAWFGDDHSLNVSEPLLGRQTNNAAEITAVEQAILKAKTNGINKLNIKTDSQFTINCITQWLGKWKRNNWKLTNGKDVINREELEKLDKAMADMEIKWTYVKGHAGHRGNEEADRLAVLGAERS